MTASAASAAAPTSSARNRRFKRVTAPETFQVTWLCPGVRESSAATDVNMGGLFIVTDKVQPQGTSLKLKLPNPGGDIPLNGIVRTAAKNGMGVEFIAIGNKERVKLDLIVKKLQLSEEAESRDRKVAPLVTMPAPVAPPKEEPVSSRKRKFARVNLPKGLKVAWIHGKQRELTIAGTVSVGGLFVLSQQPAPVGTNVRLLFDIPGGEVLATAVVRNLAPGRGMGLEFTEIRAEDKARLNTLLERLMS